MTYIGNRKMTEAEQVEVYRALERERAAEERRQTELRRQEVRRRTLEEELRSRIAESDPLNTDLINDLEGVIDRLDAKMKAPDSIKPVKLEELYKMFFALLQHLKLQVVIHEEKKRCTDSRCMKQDCVHNIDYEIRPVPKEYGESKDKLDDIIIVGEEES